MGAYKLKSIHIIIPYFGKFPNYFQLFLNSCKYNPTIAWTILTDVTEKYDCPPNVTIKNLVFADMQQRIKGAFDFDVSINTCYKLCDYKPTYAFLFPELIEGYDFWGYGDIDVIYGNLRHFLSDEILHYDKIFQLGHLTLVKNNEKYNKMFSLPLNGEPFYKKVLSSPAIYNFDERFLNRPNINDIFLQYGGRIWKDSFAADIYTKSSCFLLDEGNGVPEKRKKAVFVWDRGCLLRYVKDIGKISVCEYMYIHLQKRKMKVNVSSQPDCYKIIPNEFADLEVPVESVCDAFGAIKKQRLNLHYFRLRAKNMLAKMRARQK